jgi:hypothetical protein
LDSLSNINATVGDTKDSVRDRLVLLGIEVLLLDVLLNGLLV